MKKWLCSLDVYVFIITGPILIFFCVVALWMKVFFFASALTFAFYRSIWAFGLYLSLFLAVSIIVLSYAELKKFRFYQDQKIQGLNQDIVMLKALLLETKLLTLERQKEFDRSEIQENEKCFFQALEDMEQERIELRKEIDLLEKLVLQILTKKKKGNPKKISSDPSLEFDLFSDNRPLV